MNLEKCLKKYVMSSILSAAALLTSLIGLSSFADEDRSPYIAPKCDLTIIEPDNASGYYWSKDCKSIYVLPPLTGTVEVTAFNNQTEALELCSQLSNTFKMRSQIEKNKAKMLADIQKYEPGDARIDKIQKQLEAQTALERDLFKEFNAIHGATATLLYKSGQSQAWLNQYFLKNINTVVEHQLTLQPAPIHESYISFFAKSHSTETADLSPVIRAGIPGVPPASNRNTTVDATSLMMNGAVQAELDLSLVGSCPSVTDKNWNNDKLTAYLASNVTYTVPLKTWMGYSAKLKSDRALTNFANNIKTRTQFSVDEASTLMTTGDASDSFEFAVLGEQSNPGHFTQDAQKDFYKQVRDETLDRLTKRLLDQMVGAGFLQMDEPAPSAEKPQPGYVDEIRNGQSCSSSSIFGIKIGGGCRNFQYVVKVPVTTTAEAYMKKINDTNFENVESVRIEDIIYRVHTGTFVPPNKI